MKAKKFLALFLAAAMMCMLIAACDTGTTTSDKTTPQGQTETEIENNDSNKDVDSNKSDSNSGSEKKVLRVGVDYDFGDVSPWGVSSRGRTYYKSFAYENLVQSNYDLNPPLMDRQPWLAKEWEWVEMYKSARFTLFDYIHDANGNPITADDVVFSFNWVKDSGTVETVNTYFDSIEKIDEYTVQINLKMVAIAAMEEVINQVAIVSQKSFEESGDNMTSLPVTTSRYQMSELVPGSTLTFVRNEDYWQTDEQYLDSFQSGEWDEIIYVVINETSQMAISLETGNIDCTVAISSDEVDRFVVDGNAVDGYNYMIAPNGLINALYFNMSDDSILGDNINLRKAILYAIDADAVRKSVIGEKGKTLTDFTASNQQYYNTDWDNGDYWGYDIELAKQYFAESGLKEGQVNLTIMTSNNSAHNKAAQIIQGYLLQIGINLEILPYESALFNTYKYETNQWDMILDNKASSRALNNYYAWLFDNNTYENGGVNFIVDPEFQAHVEEGLKPDGDIEGSIEWIHDYLIDTAAVYGLWQPYTYYVGRTNVISEMYTNPINSLLPNALKPVE